MKISIITIIDNENIGTYLQAFALARLLEQMGHQPEYMDYCRPSRDTLLKFRSSLVRKAPWHWPGTWAAICRRSRNIRRQKRFIQGFLSPEHYVGYQKVAKHPPVADTYMTGSDQVWNSEYNRGTDKTFYLGFTPPEAKRVAYGASFGMSDIPEKEKAEVRTLLERYDAISVREIQGKRILSGLGFNPDSIPVVLDPTLLLDKRAWEKECAENPESEPYLLVYSLEKDNYEAINEVTRHIAGLKHLKVVCATSGSHSRLSFDTLYKSATPPLFLSLFMGASFVVASSFHGTAFSVNFRKDFITVMPGHYGSRVDSLLEQLGLQDRKYVAGLSDISRYLEPIDYSEVDKKLSAMRESSLGFLKQNL